MTTFLIPSKHLFTLNYYNEADSMRTRKGFTLVELIVVVIIIGILASMVVPYFYNMKARAIATEAVMGISAIRQVARYCSIGRPPTDILIVNIDVESGIYFPPNIVKDSDFDGLDGTYFSKECYLGMRTGPEASLRIVNRCDFSHNGSAKADEVNNLTDDGTSDAFIDMDAAGNITQSNFSRSGYPGP